MKKLLVLLLFSLSVKAQQAGIRAGVAVSNLSNTDFSAHIGYYAAFTGHLSSKGIYSLQPEMGIMRLGAKGEAVGSNGQTSQAIVADYVFLNIMNKISFHPSFGILIGPGFEQEMSNSSYLRKQSSLALNLGLALSLPGGIGFEARVRRGLRDLYNGAQAREQETQLLPFGENSFLSFQAGLFFKFPK